MASGRFREDLVARIDLWAFRLPGLTERPEDIAPNLDYELDRWAQQSGEAVSFSREARERFIAFSAACVVEGELYRGTAVGSPAGRLPSGKPLA